MTDLRGVDVMGAGRLELQDGLTARTWPVIIYGAFILMPANIYLLLVAGQNILGPISYIALVLWVEFARLTDKPLTRAEAFVVYSVSATAAAQMLFYQYALLPAYFRRSDLAAQFVAELADGRRVPFSELAPKWWSPVAEVVAQRSFFHTAWLIPIGVAVLVWAFHVMADVSLALVGRQLFIKAEKLPFPFAQPTAAACNTLTGSDPKDLKSFTVSGIVGTIWGTIVYFPVALGQPIIKYPIPWVDLNARLHTLMKGASLGVATDILTFTGGFIIPFRVIVSMLMGGLAVQFFGNYFMVRAGLFKRFAEGMNVATTHANEIDWSASIIIGGMVAAGLLQILSHPKAFGGAIAGLWRTGRRMGTHGKSDAVEAQEEEEEERPLSFRTLLLVFLAAIVGSCALFKILIPDFPVMFIFVFALLWSLLFGLIDMRAIGTTGFRVDPPYVRQGLLIGHHQLTGYSEPDVWFAPWPVALGASGWIQSFKVCDMLRCRVWSFIKAALIAVPVGMAANFIYMGIFWRIAPIPSSTYPYASVWLPRQTRFLCGFISTTVKTVGGSASVAAEMFRLDWMIGTFLIFAAIHVVFEYIIPCLGRLLAKAGGNEEAGLGRVGSLVANCPGPSLIGLAVGMAMPIPFVVSLFLGGLAGQWVKGKWGQEWYGRNRNLIVAGLALGEGVMVGIFAAIAALRNSLISQPY